MRDLLRSLFPSLSDYEVRIFAWGMLILGALLVVITGIYMVTA